MQKKIDSPFREAFALAEFAFTSEEVKLVELTEESRSLLLEIAAAKGFSPYAINQLDGRLWCIEVFALFNPTEKQLRGILAGAIADVFGGMGSWNDLGGFTDPKDSEIYQKVSEQLYSSVRHMLIASLDQKIGMFH